MTKQERRQPEAKERKPLSIVQPGELTAEVTIKSEEGIDGGQATFRWGEFHYYGTERVVQDTGTVPAGINQDGYEAAAREIVSGENGRELRKAIGVPESDFLEITAFDIQQGNFEVILMFQIRHQNRRHFLVASVSRHPEGSSSALHIASNFDNLRELGANLRAKLNPELSHKYRVVEPYFQSHLTYSDNHFAFMVMPFVGQGEIHLFPLVEISPEGKPLNRGSIMSYAVDYNKGMKERVGRQIDLSMTRVRARQERDRQPKKQHQLLEAANRILRRQERDLLRFWLIIYYAAGQRIPVAFDINAGDGMGVISDAGLDSTLITVRGGWSPKIDEPVLFHFMRQHQVRSHYFNLQMERQIIKFRPFKNIETDYFLEVLNEARAALNMEAISEENFTALVFLMANPDLVRILLTNDRSK